MGFGFSIIYPQLAFGALKVKPEIGAKAQLIYGRGLSLDDI